MSCHAAISSSPVVLLHTSPMATPVPVLSSRVIKPAVLPGRSHGAPPPPPLPPVLRAARGLWTTGHRSEVSIW